MASSAYRRLILSPIRKEIPDSACHILRLKNPKRFQVAQHSAFNYFTGCECKQQKQSQNLWKIKTPSLTNRLSRCGHSRRYFNSGKRSCWNCGVIQLQAPSEDQAKQFFCTSCSKVLPVDIGLNYFQLLNRHENFALDTETLTRDYRKLQSVLHPDKFSQLSQEEQQYSADQSSQVNKAYRTLLDPLQRAEYMLELYGEPLTETNTSANPHFLLEMFEINEALTECSSKTELHDIGQTNEDSIKRLMEECEEAFSAGKYKDAKDVVVRLKYHYNIRSTIKEKELQM